MKALDEIGPDVPVMLLTTTVYAPKQEEVNTIIREEASVRPNVTVLDWASMSEEPGMLSGDGYHPSDTGRQVMVDSIAYLLGRAPVAPGQLPQARQPQRRAQHAGRADDQAGGRGIGHDQATGHHAEAGGDGDHPCAGDDAEHDRRHHGCAGDATPAPRNRRRRSRPATPAAGDAAAGDAAAGDASRRRRSPRRRSPRRRSPRPRSGP